MAKRRRKTETIETTRLKAPAAPRLPLFLLGGLAAWWVVQSLVTSDPAPHATLPSTMGLLALAAVWALSGIERRELRVRFGWPEGLVTLLAMWIVASTLLAVQYGAAR